MCRVECCKAESSPTAAQTGADKEKQVQRNRCREKEVQRGPCQGFRCCYWFGVYLSALLLPLYSSVCTVTTLVKIVES